MRVQKTETGDFKVKLAASDRRRLHKIIQVLGPHTRLESIDCYKDFDDDKWWRLLVGQVAVMGGSRGWDQARKNPAFEQAIALNQCLAAPNAAKYLESVLQKHGATRFWQKAADKIAEAVKNNDVVRAGHIVLCEGLTSATPRDKVRAELMSRSSLFKLKSASDFMISVGLSHDVIAFDARVVGLLREAFGLDVETSRVQGNRLLYRSLESTLREVCDEIGSSLALLDRLIYQFRGTPAMSKLL